MVKEDVVEWSGAPACRGCDLLAPSHYLLGGRGGALSSTLWEVLRSLSVAWYCVPFPSECCCPLLLWGGASSPLHWVGLLSSLWVEKTLISKMESVLGPTQPLGGHASVPRCTARLRATAPRNRYRRVQTCGVAPTNGTKPKKKFTRMSRNPRQRQISTVFDTLLHVGYLLQNM